MNPAKNLFSDFLATLDKGAVHGELSRGLTELVEAIAATGKGGSLTLKVDIKPMGGINAESVSVLANVAMKKPTPAHNSTMFFVTDARELTRRDPRQVDLEDAVRTATRGAGRATEPTE